MNVFQEFFAKSYSGIYRAKIVAVENDKLKNGIYKIKAYPLMSDIEDKYLPYATSYSTDDNHHINLYKDDWVWVFFENGDALYPVILSKCNIKEKYPKQAWGDSDNKPDYYADYIKQDSDIDENKVSYNGEYNKVDGFTFSDINIEIDEDNNQFVLISPNWQLILDKDKCGHLVVKDLFIKTEAKCNIHAGDNIIKIDGDGIYIKDGNGNKFELTSSGTKVTDSNSNKIEMGSAGIKLTGSAGKVEIT